MKIVMVSHEFPADGKESHGGISTYTSLMADILKKNGHDITVLVLSYDYNDAITWNEIHVERIKTPDWIYSLKNIVKCKAGEHVVSAYIIRKRLDKICKKEKPDIVHYANFKALALFRRRDIPCVVRMSSDNTLWREAFEEQYDFEKAFRAVRFDDRLELYVDKRADGLTAPSNIVARITEKRTGCKVKVIETPPSERFEQLEAAQLPVELENKKYFLYYGGLSRMKGVHTIVEALKDFFKENPEYYFVFVGVDFGIGYKENWQSFADYCDKHLNDEKQRVIQMDFLPQDQLKSVIKKAISCVFPSRIDNLPNTCLEAMTLEKPVIGTDGASFEQLLTDGESGLLVPIDDPNALCEAMKKMVHMREEERAALGKNAKKRLEKCAPELIYEEMIAFYEEVQKRHGKKRGSGISKICLSGNKQSL